MKAKERMIKQILFAFCILFFVIAYASLRKQSLSMTEVSSQVVTISNIFLAMAALVYLCFNLFIYYKNEKNLEVILQMFIINITIALFLNLAFFNTLSSKNWLAYLELAVFNFLTILFLIGFVMGRKVKVNIERRHLYIGCVLLLFVLLSIDTFGITPRWDALVYYDSGLGEYITDIPKKFDFSLNSIRALQLAGHYSFGYSFFAAMGEFIGKGRAYGVIIIQLIVVLLSISSFYGILNYFVPKYREDFNILAACIFAFSPIVLGSYFTVCQDYFVMYLFVVMFYFEIRHWHYLALFFSVLFVFTKEPAIIIYFTFVASKWLYQYFTNNKFSWKGIYLFVKENIYDLFISIIPLLFFVLVFWVCHGSYYGHWDTTQNTGIITTTSTAQTDCFGFTFENFIVKCKQVFVLNFSWVFMIIAAVLLLRMLFRKGKETCIQHKGELLIFFIPVLSNLFFNFFYLTNWNTRYSVICVMGLYFAGILCVYQLFASRKVVAVSLGGLTVLLLIQTYTSIDIVTNTVFMAKDVGGIKVVDAAHDDMFMCSDAIVNNKSYIYIETMLNRAYRDIAEENPVICIDNLCENKALQLWGDYSSDLRALRWDRHRERFVFEQSCEEVNVYPVDEKSIKKLHSNKIYYYNVAWDNPKTLRMLKSKYKLQNCEEFSCFGWKLKRYCFLKK